VIQKPYDINIKGATIDANEENKISWKVSGAISTSFSIEIRKNTDDSVAWQLPQTTSYATSYTLPSGTLANGNEYKIKITVWDEDGNSASSDFEIFQTSSRPTATVDPISTVSSPNYTFTATYSQAESAGIKSYLFNLFDVNQNLLLSSGVQATTNPSLSYSVEGLKSETTYYIEFQVTSSKGLTGTSGLIQFSVLYTQPQVNVNLTAANTEDAGIKLSWNVIQIIGSSDSPPTFVDSEKVDLTDGNRVWFDEGFSVNKDFTLKIWLESPKHKTDLLLIKGENGEITLQYDKRFERFFVYKKVGNVSVSYQSPQVGGTSFYVCIQQIDKDINLIAETI
jgi:hypothetical protein